VENVHDVVKPGQSVSVRVLTVEDGGKVALTMKSKEAEAAAAARVASRSEAAPGGGGGSGPKAEGDGDSSRPRRAGKVATSAGAAPGFMMLVDFFPTLWSTLPSNHQIFLARCMSVSKMHVSQRGLGHCRCTHVCLTRRPILPHFPLPESLLQSNRRQPRRAPEAPGAQGESGRQREGQGAADDALWRLPGPGGRHLRAAARQPDAQRVRHRRPAAAQPGDRGRGAGGEKIGDASGDAPRNSIVPAWILDRHETAQMSLFSSAAQITRLLCMPAPDCHGQTSKGLSAKMQRPSCLSAVPLYCRPQVRVLGVKDGKIDVTQLTKEETAMEAEAEGGVGTKVSKDDTSNLFSFMLARAGVKSRAFETEVRTPPHTLRLAVSPARCRFIQLCLHCLVILPDARSCCFIAAPSCLDTCR